MKKILMVIAILMLTAVSVRAAVVGMQSAMSQNDRKPMAVLVYANWAKGYQNALSQFRKVEQTLENTYNFVELDIASKDAKFYNDTYIIYTKLPYVMLLRENGRFSMLLKQDCTASASCMTDKMKGFIP